MFFFFKFKGTPDDLNESINATDYRNRVWAQMCPPSMSEKYPSAEQIEKARKYLERKASK